MHAIKYRFDITYQTKQLKQVSDFMKACDLGEGEICLKETYGFNYTSEEKPIAYFKGLLTQAIESIGGRVLQIEGGKIE